MITIATLADLRARAGQEIGISDWVAIDQQRITAFADATGDHQWIHVDVARAAREAPFGATIAHGFLTLSLVSTLMRNTVSIAGLRMTINYGLNRVRFVSPVPAGSRVRARVALHAVDDVKDATQATWGLTVEREGGDKPCLVAEWLVRYYHADEGHEGHEGHEG
ncbi:MAG TPA: MaoC family dehydratase [Vicinamibacterales bacterium]|nr:MaoC family dehydratase [Vicinamibacterales bacterium]